MTKPLQSPLLCPIDKPPVLIDNPISIGKPMDTQINTMSTVEFDPMRMLLARQTATVLMGGPDDDENIDPFEDDDD